MKAFMGWILLTVTWSVVSLALGNYDCNSWENVTISEDCSDMKGCTTCTNPPLVCNQCRHGFGVHWSQIYCVTCPPFCTSCVVAKAANHLGYVITECTGCNDGFYLGIGNAYCKLCPTNCDACSTTDTCDTCAAGYAKASDGRGMQCLGCSENCESCLDADNCVSCSDGSYRSGRVCVDCPPFCSLCGAGGNCLECSEGSRMLTGTSSCAECSVNNCAVCDVSSCDICKAGFYLSFDLLFIETCEACPVHCEICDELGSCRQCAHGYYTNDQETCSPCQHNCNSCDGMRSCLQCDVGTYKEGLYCYDCAVPLCLTCSNDSYSCAECQEGYFFDSTVLQCRACDSLNCITCSTSNSCATCRNGTYLTDADQCEVCVDGCHSCSDGASCDECDPGYCWDVESDQCVETPYSSYCKTCSKVGDTVNCLDCAPSNNVPSMYQQICTACEPSHCITCTSDTSSCEVCADGFYWSAPHGRCLSCPNSPNCKTCENSLECVECFPGFFGAECYRCPVGCSNCTSRQSCDQCADSNYYFDTEELECKRCSSGCSLCTSASVCDVCESHSVANDFSPGSCLSCDVGCEMCDLVSEGQTSCTSCLTGYFLSRNSCIRCSYSFPDCSSCADVNGDSLIQTGECFSCESGSLTEGQSDCNSCGIINCEVCENRPKSCCSCGTQYTAVNGECIDDGTKCLVNYCEQSEESEEDEDDNYKNCTYQFDLMAWEYCLDLDATQSCWSQRLETSAGLLVYTRGCRNTTCTDASRIHTCTKSGSELTCGICCDSDRCNSHPVRGIKGVSVAASVVDRHYHVIVVFLFNLSAMMSWCC